MATTTSGASEPDSVEALKRVKATENEWDARLAAARQETTTELGQLRSEAAVAVKSAEQEADKNRAARIETARADIEKEAAAILTEGQKAAAEALEGTGRSPADKKSAILDVVLASFGKE